MSRVINQEIAIEAPFDAVYGVLTDPSQFSGWTGAPEAKIDLSSGGEVLLFGGMIEGQTVVAIPNKRIVQMWRVAEWDLGDFLIVKFDLERDGAGTQDGANGVSRRSKKSPGAEVAQDVLGSDKGLSAKVVICCWKLVADFRPWSGTFA